MSQQKTRTVINEISCELRQKEVRIKTWPWNFYHFHSSNGHFKWFTRCYATLARVEFSSYWFKYLIGRSSFKSYSVFIASKCLKYSWTSGKRSFACDRSLNETDLTQTENLLRRPYNSKNTHWNLIMVFVLMCNTCRLREYKNTFVYVPTLPFGSLLSNITTSS